MTTLTFAGYGVNDFNMVHGGFDARAIDELECRIRDSWGATIYPYCDETCEADGECRCTPVTVITVWPDEATDGLPAGTWTYETLDTGVPYVMRYASLRDAAEGIGGMGTTPEELGLGL